MKIAILISKFAFWSMKFAPDINDNWFENFARQKRKLGVVSYAGDFRERGHFLGVNCCCWYAEFGVYLYRYLITFNVPAKAVSLSVFIHLSGLECDFAWQTGSEICMCSPSNCKTEKHSQVC